MALSPRQTLNGQRVRRIPGSALKIGTWNVRSMYEAGKLQNATREMERMQICVLGVSEVRWKGHGLCDTDNHTFYYSCNDEDHHRHGVGVIVSKTVSVKNFVPLSDRVMMLQLRSKPIDINIIQVYAPTSDADDNVVEAFYMEVKEMLKLTKPHEVNIVMGDFNAKIGRGSVDGVVGRYGLGVRNERGDRLVQFCQEEDLVATNTFFNLPPRRLYTWKSPQDNPQNIVRNQIDYILVNRRFRNSIPTVRTYPGADVASDHNPVVARLRVRLTTRRAFVKPSIDVRKLDDPDIRKCVEQDLSSGLREIGEEMDENGEVDAHWCKIKEVLKVTAEKHLTADATRRQIGCLSNSILDLMEERRECKNRDQQRYDELQTEIRRKTREANARLMDSKCREIEELQRKHDTFHLHKKIKEFSGRRPKQSARILVNNQNEIVATVSEKLKLWEQYVQELFDDVREENHGITDANEGPDILREEVVRAIRTSKSGKAAGPDNVRSELFKALEDENDLNTLVSLFNKIYRTGVIPVDWLKSTFIPFPKKSNARRCDDHRTISLMSLVMKLFLKVVHQRIYRKCEELLSDTQFGFRGGFGTRDALFAVKVLVQRCRDVNKDVYLLFIDYEKAFDRVQHDKLLEILKRTGLDDRDIRIVANLYWNQLANVRVDGTLSDEVRIRRGVRQGCVLSPLLFNLYSETILSEALDGFNQGISVNGEVINNMRYADDTGLLCGSADELQALLDHVNRVSNEYGLRMNVRKTKFMIISKNAVDAQIFIAGERVERVRSFKYLGCWLNEDWDETQEIRARIEQARDVFLKMKKLLCRRELSLKLRMRIVRCYVFPVLLYGCEGWTLTKALEKNLEAFEMWCYRRMLKIPWTDFVRNTEVLDRMGKKVELLYDVKRRQLEYFGHVMRNEKYRLLQLIIQGKIEGRRGPGRRKTSWLKNLRDWYGVNSISLFRAAVSKIRIATMIANLRRGDGI